MKKPYFLSSQVFCYLELVVCNFYASSESKIYIQFKDNLTIKSGTYK